MNGRLFWRIVYAVNVVIWSVDGLVWLGTGQAPPRVVGAGALFMLAMFWWLTLEREA